jgi:hypothetical protein
MLVLLILLVLSIFGNVALAKMLWTTISERRSLEKTLERQRLKGDDDIFNYIEASAASGNTTFKRMLAAKEEPKALPPAIVEVKPPEPPSPPKWLHDTSVAVSPEEHWDLFVKDMNRELNPKDRLEVLYHWAIEQRVRFTDAEKGLVIDMFEDPESRKVVRRIFTRASKNSNRRHKPKTKISGSGGPSAA